MQRITDKERLIKELKKTIKDSKTLSVCLIIGIFIPIFLLIVIIGAVLNSLKCQRLKKNSVLKSIIKDLSQRSKPELKQLSKGQTLEALTAEFLLNETSIYVPVILLTLLVALVVVIILIH